MLTGLQIRRKFLEFFEKKGHKIVHSSSLVPHNDPTLLFTNAGMNQFKDVFLGLEKRDYTRATSSQKCVRAGGKHNDLENVGFTNRHHTFFEMLGNFSFGDYFKKEAIAYAWELITSPQWFGISKDKLYVTIFKGEGPVPRDVEAYNLWLAQGVAKNRIFEFGLKDNFWQMGDTGPCGPCSEIHYDMGPAASDQGHTDCAFGCDCGRYVEIWNLVFMQFDRDANGKLNPLPKPSIDTGAGLERLAAVLQGKISNYETDLFVPLIKRAAELTGTSLTKELQKEAHAKSAASLRVIADHSRAATFLISDGVLPSNEGRGYVLRKIIRRAITHGRLLGQTKPFLHELVFAVRDLMQDAYPELKETAARVSKVLSAEEKRFAHTLALGLQAMHLIVEGHPGIVLLAYLGESGDKKDSRFVAKKDKETLGTEFTRASVIAGIRAKYPPKIAAEREAKVIELLDRPKYLTGEEAFLLYGTYGMPLDFIRDYCRDRAIEFEESEFDRALTNERERARASWKGAAKQTANPAYQQLPKSEFEGCLQTRSENCEVLAIIKNGQGAQELKPGDEGEVLGKHVKQAGSLVAPNHLRFDFSHFTAVEDEELQDIEDMINKEVLRNQRVEVIENVPIDVAVNEYKAMALFGEKYGDRVRVIKIGDFSTELCGGTHTGATGEIGLIKILKEGSVSSGVRRVEAVTGEGSLRHFRKDHELETVVSRFVVPTLAQQTRKDGAPSSEEATTSPAEALKIELDRKDAEIKRLARELDQARMKSASSSVASVGEKIKEVRGVKVLAHRVDNLERAQMRTLVDQLREKLGSGVVVLGSAANGNVALIVGVTKDLTARIQAGKVIGPVAQKVGGKGGGRPDLAEAGGKNPEALDSALQEVYRVVDSLLG